MPYIHLPTNRYPLSPKQIREENPNVSFAHPFEPFPEYVSVAGSTPPDHDAHTHTAHELMPALIDGVWTQQWEIVERSAEEIEQLYNDQAAVVRAERNAKLTASDWTQVLDAKVDRDAWSTYRQALRDITSQAGFPWAVEWPTPPAAT